jgi:hypothetical protein
MPEISPIEICHSLEEHTCTHPTSSPGKSLQLCGLKLVRQSVRIENRTLNCILSFALRWNPQGRISGADVVASMMVMIRIS